MLFAWVAQLCLFAGVEVIISVSRALGFAEFLMQLTIFKRSQAKHVLPMSEPLGNCWPFLPVLGQLAKEVTATAGVRSLSGTMWTGGLHSAWSAGPTET